jgi:hypothetical protein
VGQRALLRHYDVSGVRPHLAVAVPEDGVPHAEPFHLVSVGLSPSNSVPRMGCRGRTIPTRRREIRVNVGTVRLRTRQPPVVSVVARIRIRIPFT